MSIHKPCCRPYDPATDADRAGRPMIGYQLCYHQLELCLLFATLLTKDGEKMAVSRNRHNRMRCKSDGLVRKMCSSQERSDILFKLSQTVLLIDY
jgi:hypothetical protein